MLVVVCVDETDVLIVLQVAKTFLLPHIPAEGEKLRTAIEGPIFNNIEKIAAEHIRQLIVVGLRR